MYRWNPEDYARNSTGQEKWARELLAQLHLHADDAVLDVGCGDGRITATIAASLPQGRAVGTDLSADMIAFAQQQYPRDAHPNLSFRNIDMRALDFNGEFSVVYSNAAMHWVKDHRPILQGISRALKPGGRCLLQMGGFGNAVEAIAAFEACFTQPRWASAFQGFESTYGFHHPQDYRIWLAEAGLAPQQVQLIEKDMAHPDAIAFTGWLRTAWHPYTAPLPAADRDAFITDVAQQYLAAHPAYADGQVHVRMVRLQVAATKP